jgi:hypothetical protein
MVQYGDFTVPGYQVERRMILDDLGVRQDSVITDYLRFFKFTVSINFVEK